MQANQDIFEFVSGVRMLSPVVAESNSKDVACSGTTGTPVVSPVTPDIHASLRGRILPRLSRRIYPGGGVKWMYQDKQLVMENLPSMAQLVKGSRFYNKALKPCENAERLLTAVANKLEVDTRKVRGPVDAAQGTCSVDHSKPSHQLLQPLTLGNSEDQPDFSPCMFLDIKGIQAVQGTASGYMVHKGYVRVLIGYKKSTQTTELPAPTTRSAAAKKSTGERGSRDKSKRIALRPEGRATKLTKTKIQPVWEYAHRVVAWALMGPPDASQHVMHTCDKKACVHPHHLVYGSASDNASMHHATKVNDTERRLSIISRLQERKKHMLRMHADVESDVGTRCHAMWIYQMSAC